VTRQYQGLSQKDPGYEDVLKAVGSDLLPQSAVGTAELILQFDQILITLTAPTYTYNRPIT
jgi:hypothetical protein